MLFRSRNGRLDATPSEWALRASAPGAIVVPNLDTDGRRLPATVSLGSRVTLDRDQPVILANDDEALRLRVVVNRDSAPAGSRFFLRPQGFARIRLRFNDAAGRILPDNVALPGDIPVPLPAAPGALDLTLTTRTLPGSPIGHVTDLNTRFSLDLEDESALMVQLVSIDPGGVETVQDQARFTIAPFVILDNASTAVRLYCCDIPQNQPSLIELREAEAEHDPSLGGIELDERLDPQGRFDPERWIFEQLNLRLPLVNRCGADCPGPARWSSESGAPDPRWSALRGLKPS